MSAAIVAVQIAEAFRTYAAERYEAQLTHPELPWLEQPSSMARHYRKVADDLRAQADRIEAAAEAAPEPLPVTDTAIEAGARIIHGNYAETPFESGAHTWAMGTMRAALEAVEAARKGSTPNQENGS